MRIEVDGHLSIGDTRIKVVGMLVNASNGAQIGHCVVEDKKDILAICAAVGQDMTITLELSETQHLPIFPKVIEVESKTMRFLVHAGS